MHLSQLIERLQGYMDDLGDVEVRTMTQENWPFENAIHGLCSNREIDDTRSKDPDEDDDEEPAEEKPAIVYIVEGSQLCYGTKKAWEAAY